MVRGSLHTKKDGTNGLAVRAGRPVTQTTSSSRGSGNYPSTTGIYTPYHRQRGMQIQNLRILRVFRTRFAQGKQSQIFPPCEIAKPARGSESGIFRLPVGQADGAKFSYDTRQKRDTIALGKLNLFGFKRFQRAGECSGRAQDSLVVAQGGRCGCSLGAGWRTGCGLVLPQNADRDAFGRRGGREFQFSYSRNSGRRNLGFPSSSLLTR